MMLTLLTSADARGTSEHLWNSFKDSLLWTLFSKTMDLLSGKDFRAAQAKQIELLKEEVRGLLPPTFSPDEFNAHFDNLPPRYFEIHSSRSVPISFSL